MPQFNNAVNVEWRLSTPEIRVAQNGFVISHYDIGTDSTVLRVAQTVEEVRAEMRRWADKACADIEALITRRIGAALQETADNAPRTHDC